MCVVYLTGGFLGRGKMLHTGGLNAGTDLLLQPGSPAAVVQSQLAGVQSVLECGYTYISHPTALFHLVRQSTRVIEAKSLK